MSSILCGNPRPHDKTVYIKGRPIKKHSEYCEALLKIYKEPAVFEEYLFCPVCKTHWRVVLKENGSCTAMRIPDEVIIKNSPKAVRYIGEKIRVKSNAH